MNDINIYISANDGHLSGYDAHLSGNDAHLSGDDPIPEDISEGKFTFFYISFEQRFDLR